MLIPMSVRCSTRPACRSTVIYDASRSPAPPRMPHRWPRGKSPPTGRPRTPGIDRSPIRTRLIWAYPQLKPIIHRHIHMIETFEADGSDAGPEPTAAPDRRPAAGQSIVAHRALTAPETVDRIARTVEVVCSTGAHARNFAPASA